MSYGQTFSAHFIRYKQVCPTDIFSEDNILRGVTNQYAEILLYNPHLIFKGD